MAFSSRPSAKQNQPPAQQLDTHLRTELHLPPTPAEEAAGGPAGVSDLLAALESAHCRPLDWETATELLEVARLEWTQAQAEAEAAATEGKEGAPTNQREQRTVDAKVVADGHVGLSSDDEEEAATASAAIASHGAPSIAELAPPPVVPVIILDLSSSPPRQVDSISAFGLTFAPIRSDFIKKTRDELQPTTSATSAASSSSSSASASLSLGAAPSSSSSAALDASTASLVASLASLLPSDNSSSSASKELVTFYSIESALYAAPAVGDGFDLTQHQRLAELPALIALNKAAMVPAEAKEDAAAIGALLLEKKTLVSELKKLESIVPSQGDVIEVRDTISLPFGFVPIGKRIYYLMRASDQSVAHPRQLVVAQTHPHGQFHPSPFVDALLGASSSFGLARFPGSTIFQPVRHARAIAAVCGGRAPKIGRLMYQASKDGYASAQFHSRCDQQGPNFGLVRTTTGCVFGWYTDSSWAQTTTQGHGDAFLFTFVSDDSGASSTSTSATPQRVRKLVLDTPMHNSVYHQTNFGPLFGVRGQALLFADQMNTSTCSSCTGRPNGYRPADYCTGWSWGTSTLAGAASFAVAEMEIYAVDPMPEHNAPPNAMWRKMFQ